jgi:hypothetical protein
MNSTQQKQLKELRKRLAILDGVIAEFERLDAIRKRKLKTHSAGSGVRRYNSSPTRASRGMRRPVPDPALGD